MGRQRRCGIRCVAGRGPLGEKLHMGSESAVLMDHEPDVVLILRPLVPRLWAIGAWIMIGLAVYIVPSVVMAGGPSSSPPAITLGALVAIIGSWWSASRLAFSISTRGIEIRNAICTRHIEWDDIAEIGIKYVGLPTQVGHSVPRILLGRTPPAVGIRLRTGKYVPAAQATAYLPAESRRRVIDVLTAEAGSRGVSISVRADDLQW